MKRKWFMKCKWSAKKVKSENYKTICTERWWWKSRKTDMRSLRGFTKEKKWPKREKLKGDKGIINSDITKVNMAQRTISRKYLLTSDKMKSKWKRKETKWDQKSPQTFFQQSLPKIFPTSSLRTPKTPSKVLLVNA